MNSHNPSCPSCGSSFHCGGTSCWCLRLPAWLPVTSESGCLCPDCLHHRLGSLIERKLGSLSHEQSLQLARSENRRSAPVEHLDYTMEDGKLVFTRWYLLKRGKCCGEKCRNCPFPESERPRERDCRPLDARPS